MGAQASHKFARIPPRKCRLAADLVRGKNYADALAMLHFTNNKGSALVAKLLQSAFHNATFNLDLNGNRLYVQEIWVDEAGAAGIHGKLKRFQPRAQGRAYPILKRASHIHVVLEER